jgi:hypothetical protein
VASPPDGGVAFSVVFASSTGGCGAIGWNRLRGSPRSLRSPRSSAGDVGAAGGSSEVPCRGRGGTGEWCPGWNASVSSSRPGRDDTANPSNDGPASSDRSSTGPRAAREGSPEEVSSATEPNGRVASSSAPSSAPDPDPDADSDEDADDVGTTGQDPDGPSPAGGGEAGMATSSVGGVKTGGGEETTGGEECGGGEEAYDGEEAAVGGVY